MESFILLLLLLLLHFFRSPLSSIIIPNSRAPSLGGGFDGLLCLRLAIGASQWEACGGSVGTACSRWKTLVRNAPGGGQAPGQGN